MKYLRWRQFRKLLERRLNVFFCMDKCLKFFGLEDVVKFTYFLNESLKLFAAVLNERVGCLVLDVGFLGNEWDITTRPPLPQHLIKRIKLPISSKNYKIAVLIHTGNSVLNMTFHHLGILNCELYHEKLLSVVLQDSRCLLILLKKYDIHESRLLGANAFDRIVLLFCIGENGLAGCHITLILFQLALIRQTINVLLTFNLIDEGSGLHTCIRRVLYHHATIFVLLVRGYYYWLDGRTHIS